MENTSQTNLDTALTEEVPAGELPGKETVQPEYSQVTDTSEPNTNKSLHRFLDVEVTVSAELGRVELPIGELIGLGEGSVIELGRSISEPVDLMAQGQRVASGEVVVIDDCFAVRITNIDAVEPEA